MPPSSSSSSSSSTRRRSRSNAAASGASLAGTRRGPTSISDALGVEILGTICRAVLHETIVPSTTTSRCKNSEASSSSPSEGLGRLRSATPPSTLLVLDSRWHFAASRVLYETLTLPDDDEFLLLAVGDTSSPQLPSAAAAQTDAEGPAAPPAEADARSSAVLGRTTRQLSAINNNDVYAGSVRSLRIVPGKTAWRQAHEDLPSARSSRISSGSAVEEDVSFLCLHSLTVHARKVVAVAVLTPMALY